jgi:hypothetical protein
MTTPGILHELAGVAAGDVAEIIGRDHVLHVKRRALLHDRLGVTLALVRDDELLERDDLARPSATGAGIHAALQLEVPRGGLPGLDRDLAVRAIVARVRHGDDHFAGGDVREHVGAVVAGEGHGVGALDRDLGVADIFLCRRIEDTTRNPAGGRSLGLDGRRQDGGEEGGTPQGGKPEPGHGPGGTTQTAKRNTCAATVEEV